MLTKMEAKQTNQYGENEAKNDPRAFGDRKFSSRSINKDGTRQSKDTTSSPSLNLRKPVKIIEDTFGFYNKIGKVKSNQSQQSSGSVVKRYTLINNIGTTIQIINYGATVISVRVPDKDGVEDDIVLGFDDLKGYTSSGNHYFGSTIGRVAGLTTGAVVKIGKEYYLSTNFGDNHLHGGLNGFDKALWDSYVYKNKVIMTLVSPDGDEGYPGSVMVQLSFTLTYNNLFVINTQALTSKPTPISISNHTYFNLAGHGKGPAGLKEQCLMVNADKFLKKDLATGIPTGELENVGSTFYDLRVPRPLEKILTRVPGGGYKDTFCLTKGYPKKACTFAARLLHPESGRFLEIITDHPGLHVYTGNDLPNPDEPFSTEAVLSFDLFRPETHDDDFFMRKIETDFPRPESDPEEEHEFIKYCDVPSELEISSSSSSVSLGDLDDPDNKKNLKKSRKMSKAKEEKEEHECSDSDASEDDSKTKHGIAHPKEIEGKMGCTYRNHGGIALMPMEYPDAVKYRNFPNPIIRPGEVYDRTIVYKFGLLPPAKSPDLIEIAQNVPGSSQNFDASNLGDENESQGFLA